jgi:hypothetical protein
VAKSGQVARRLEEAGHVLCYYLWIMRILLALVIVVNRAKYLFAGQLPSLTFKETGLMLRSGYSSETILRDLVPQISALRFFFRQSSGVLALPPARALLCYRSLALRGKPVKKLKNPVAQGIGFGLNK